MAVSNDTLSAQVQELTRRLNEMQSVISAVSPIATAGNASFLAGLSKMSSPGGVSADGGSGNYWISGERAALNVWASTINSILGTAISSGFMNPA